MPLLCATTMDLHAISHYEQIDFLTAKSVKHGLSASLPA